MRRGKILITPRSLSQGGHPELSRLTAAGFETIAPFPGRQPSADELMAVLPDCVGFLAGVEKIDAEVLDCAPNLKVISRNGAGIDNIDVRGARERGIAVAAAPGANARGVAELAIGLLFSLVRSIPFSHGAVQSGGWERVRGIEVRGRTLGVFGTGRIGRETAKMAAGLEMRVLAHDIYPDEALEEALPLEYVSKDDLFARSEAVSLHAPAGEGPLIGEECLGNMRRGMFIINTARAGLVDEQALLGALESEIVAGYAADAFVREPPVLGKLLRHPKVITSPHIGGFTEESVNRATAAAVDNLLEALGG